MRPENRSVIRFSQKPGFQMEREEEIVKAVMELQGEREHILTSVSETASKSGVSWWACNHLRDRRI